MATSNATSYTADIKENRSLSSDVTKCSNDDVTASSLTTSTTTQFVLKIYGLPGYRFYLVHYTALCALSITIICSSLVLFYLNYPCRRSFYSRNIGTWR